MHNDAKAFADHTIERKSDDRPRYTADAGGLLRYLWARIDSDVDSVTDADLEWLSSASGNAQMMAMNLSKTLSGVAMLISCDAAAEGSRAGAFQPADLPEFLWGAADVARTIEEVVTVASDSEFHLRERFRRRAESATGLRMNCSNEQEVKRA
ncbi:hypothetical protein [Paraburkholderia heleia]|uniref:hypothetical protein n=1 Tax=Paraburkholderia heleia TaxID=634127 RepID=UPI002AB65ECC|nr:hypothetical protein [Paraburkholderia heleia]